MARKSENTRFPGPFLSVRLCVLPILLMVLLLAACDSIVSTITEPPIELPIDNPLDPDPDNPGFVPPNTTILTPTTGSTQDSASVEVTWQGNTGVVAFQDSVAGGSWSAWSSLTSKTFGPLDEGNYTVFIRAAYDSSIATLIEDVPASITFTVDAVQGASLRFSPPYLEGGTTGEIDLALVAEDVSNLMMVKAVFTFDPSVVTLNPELNDWSDSQFLSGNGGSVLSFYEVDTVGGRFEINLSVVEGDPAGVTGTGTLLNLTFSGTAAGLSTLAFVSAKTEMRDPSNKSISIVNLVDAQIRVR